MVKCMIVWKNALVSARNWFTVTISIRGVLGVLVRMTLADCELFHQLLYPVDRSKLEKVEGSRDIHTTTTTDGNSGVDSRSIAT